MTGTPDVFAVGETMFSLVALDGSLDDATTFRATHGGAESNTCVALTRLGTSAAWVSRLGTDPPGDRITAALGAERVGLSWVKRDPDLRSRSEARHDRCCWNDHLGRAWKPKAAGPLLWRRV